MKKVIQVTEFKKYRIIRGFSQKDLANKLNVAVSTIGGYERGDNFISKPMGKMLASILKVKFSILFKEVKKNKYKVI